MDFLRLALPNLASPAVLFFLLGLVAARLRSDLELPPAVAKGVSLYLIFAVGFRGGSELTHLQGGLGPFSLAGLALSLGAGTTLLAWFLLRLWRRVRAVDRAAIAAHYGSVSVGTFAAGVAFIQAQGWTLDGGLMALLAAMEAPGILLALLLAPRSRSLPWHELLSGGALLLLLGSLAIGALAGEAGRASLQPLVVGLFPGVLCLFLLDMGITAGRRLSEFREAGWSLALFGLLMPLLGGGLGLLAAWAVGLDASSRAQVALLAGSASYIAAPAAVRQSLPEASLSLPLGLSLAVTFPFNVLVGIPLWHALSQRLG